MKLCLPCDLVVQKELSVLILLTYLLTKCILMFSRIFEKSKNRPDVDGNVDENELPSGDSPQPLATSLDDVMAAPKFELQRQPVPSLQQHVSCITLCGRAANDVAL